MTSRPAPTSLTDRLPHLDALRGFALLGVLLSNIHFWFRAPRGHQNLFTPAWGGIPDQTATWLIRAVVDAKFIFIFSMLFGVGLALQAERFHTTARLVRRLLGLAVIGALHVLLLWNGDILLPYACLGLLALPFARRSLKVVRRWALGSLAVVLLLMLVGPLIKAFGAPHPAPMAADLQAWDAWERDFIASLARHYLDPSWWAVARFRVLDYGRILRESGPGFVVVFLNLLTGLWIWKSGLLQRPQEHLEGLRRFSSWALPLGLASHAVYASRVMLKLWSFQQPWGVRRWLPLVLDGSMLVGAFLLSLGMASLLLWLWGSGRFQKGLAWLAPLGRMALSAYLLQSLVMTSLFYGWGAARYNRMGPLAGALLGMGFYAFQVGLCRWWSSRFLAGPVEWLWRSWTYGRIQPFRRPGTSRVGGGLGQREPSL